jgi:cytochrome c551/c552
MLKVLVAALIGTAAGVAVMVIVIVAAGTTTSNASSVGLGSLPITTASPSSSTSTSPPPSSSSGGSTSGGSSGNAAAGKAIFTGSAGCSGCHTLTPAGATGTVGPNLDNISADQQASGVPLDQFIEESITDPDKYIAKGFSPGVMPPNFATTLSKSQIADLVALISSAQPSS